MTDPAPLSLVAVRLLERARRAKAAGVLFIASSEARAAEVGRIVRALAADVIVVEIPAWDCLPYDRAPPSREAMGRRMAAIRQIRAHRSGPMIVAAAPDALVQRIPPAEALKAARTIKVSDVFDTAALEADLIRAGYVADDRVDEAGELAIRGQVIEVFPPAAAIPYRLDISDGRVEAIRTYDPVSQRTTAKVREVVLDPASELVLGEAEERFAGAEHWLPGFYERLDTFFDLLPKAVIVRDERAPQRLAAVQETIAEAYADRTRLRREEAEARAPLKPSSLYLTDSEWQAAAGSAEALSLADVEPTPQFASGASPGRAFAAFVREELSAGRRVVVAAATERDLSGLLARAGRASGQQGARVEDWQAVLDAPAGVLLGLLAPATRGFRDPRIGVTFITAGDVLGSRALMSAESAAAPPWFSADEEFGMDDVVVHIDHGVGLLRGLERVETTAGVNETLRLEYAKGATLLVPIEEIGKLWRYGSDPEAIALDHLNTSAWSMRRDKVEREVAQTAETLARLARGRREAEAPKLVPPGVPYERMAARFPFSLTHDQGRAIEEALTDLASGHPMDRLVVGDVGYGKTEVAVRAAAAAALAGRQVVVAAPTTVLVRQHVETFLRRFADLGIEVAHLSRLVAPAEAKRVKAGLASGDIRIVIGTHAVAGKGIALAEPGLVIIDEEQRFGAADKRKLRDLAQGGHVLTLTATPIPRTLQAALVGLQDLSVIATPPVRRRPIRTFNITCDPATVRAALVRERRRGGQSFVVVPRIEDIESVSATLRNLVPQLSMRVAHGGMKAAEVDEAMVAFGDGDGDVLLATNIIESGLDVPNANTMIVWRADLFGLAQLHQLRGRVGRGRAQGVCYLLSEAGEDSPAAKRLGTLATLDRLGSGMAISARDLDSRGAGDLVGDEQAGHLKLIGPGLYQHLLERALKAAQGRPVEDLSPVLNIGEAGALPPDYIPEPELRINAYSRLARAAEESDLDRLLEELEDRFGPLPSAAADLMAAERVRLLCRRQAVARLDAGPQAIALTFATQEAAAHARGMAAEMSEAEWKAERLVVRRASETLQARLALAVEVLGELA